MTADSNHELVQLMELRFAQVDEAFAEQRQFIEFLYNKLDKRIDSLEQRFDRLERTILRFIDVQMKTNELVERRLLLLERANPMRPM